MKNLKRFTNEFRKIYKKIAAYYIILKNKCGVKKADEYLRECFINFYINNRSDELVKLVHDYINEKYLDENILGKIEQYVNNNEVDTKKLEELIAIMEELV